VLALDTEAAVDVAVDENGNDATNLFFDAVASARLGRNVEAIVRPFVQRLGATGEWNRQIWVAALRYERAGPIGIRVDGGLIPSPVGYANMLAWMEGPGGLAGAGLPASLALAAGEEVRARARDIPGWVGGAGGRRRVPLAAQVRLAQIGLRAARLGLRAARSGGVRG